MWPTAAKAIASVLVPVALACLAAPARSRAGPGPEPPGVLLDVPFVRQTKNECGAASLSMVMRYWERSEGQPASSRATEPAIEQALDPRARGISNAALAAYLLDSGYRAFAFAGRWSDLRENLAKGRPLIAGLGPAAGRGPLHYVVVAGMDWERNLVFINDPARRKLVRMDRLQFENQWKASGNWTLLAVPKLRA